jgi:hypothetical protein
MSDTGSRPRPRYGEYATPEEQRAAVKSPEKNPHYAPPEPQPSAPPPARVQTDVGHPSAPPETADRQAGASAPALLRHPLDRVVTIALLVLGLYNVVTTIMERGSVADQIDAVYHSMGLTGDYAATALTGTVVDVVAIVYLALWVVAAGLSSWAILRGRIAFWIPLAAGVVASLISGAGYLILFLHDPTFLAYVQQVG